MSELARLRLGADVGGTFTDLIVDGLPGGLRLFKSSTTPDDPTRGLLDTIGIAADSLGLSTRELLGRATQIVHGTTRATNAIVTSSTARTAFLCTEGHPDTLLWREGGGRLRTLDFSQPFPEPYVPRALTFEIPERMRWDGTVHHPLDESAARDTLARLGEIKVEAVAVCLLWSIVNPAHELVLGDLIEEILPGVPYTLSHQLNPTIREYRRASATSIDASLKPLMSRYFAGISQTLKEEGFAGRLLTLTSSGGVLDADQAARAPIHSVGSGPAAAPSAGQHYARLDASVDTAIVMDAGGTTFDVSLLRGGEIPWNREATVGPFPGFMLGFPSLDVRSIGAGGGSIAWVDDGGLLHVGPESAGSEPGPASYGHGGGEPTVTDSAVLLGYIDPQYFLGGKMVLDPALATAAVERGVAKPSGLGVEEAAGAIFELACERMVTAIEEITLNQGVDPRRAIMIGGGGGAGLYSVPIARRLGVRRIVVPETAAGLSATGALVSDLRSDKSAFLATDTDAFDFVGVNATLAELRRLSETFITESGVPPEGASIRFAVEARYPRQHWEIEVPLRVESFAGDEDVEVLRRDFHATHERVFAHRDERSKVEFVAWHASARCPLPELTQAKVEVNKVQPEPRTKRDAFFAGRSHPTPVYRLESLAAGDSLEGPVIVETPATTIVVPPDAVVTRAPSGSLILDLVEGGPEMSPLSQIRGDARR